MKKIITGVSIASLMLPVLALAATPAPSVDLMTALNSLTNLLFTILLIVAVIFIILAGYYFVTSQGDPDKAGKARNFVLWALVGIAVAVAAKALVAFVQMIMGA